MNTNEEIQLSVNRDKSILFIYLPQSFIEENGKPPDLEFWPEKNVWYQYLFQKESWKNIIKYLKGKVDNQYIQKIRDSLKEGRNYAFYIKYDKAWVKTNDNDLLGELVECGFKYSYKTDFYFATFQTVLDNESKLRDLIPDVLFQVKEEVKDKPELYIQKSTKSKQIDLEKIAKLLPPYLYDFQKEFVIKALSDYFKGNPGIMLADDVGLGKTVQSLALADVLFKLGEIDKVLIITKKNVVRQFASEAEKFLNIEPAILSTQEWKPDTSKVLITNYEPIVKFVENWNLMPQDKRHRILFIIDEISSLKSSQNNRVKAFKKMFKMYPGFRVGLTATPFGKELVEMYNMFKILVPDFMDWYTFDYNHRDTYRINKTITTKYGYKYTKEIEVVSNYKNFEQFHEAIAPYMVRRKKSMVEKEFGPKIEHPVFLPASDNFLYLYRKFMEDIIDAVEKKYKEKDQGQAKFLGVSLLRQFCNYIGLFEKSESQLLKYIPYKQYLILTPTPKLDWVINKVKEINDKVLIFTEFARMAEILDKTFIDLGYKTRKITGATNKDDRELLKQQFEKDKFQILIGTNAMAYGGNFQFVDYLINYDLSYNPEVNWQREGRIHRLGNTNTKHIYNLFLSSNDPDFLLIEELIYETLQRRMKEAELATSAEELKLEHDDTAIINDITKTIFKQAKKNKLF